MTHRQELVIAASTIWVVVAAVLVMFMQAGFAFLEAGLTRMKNAGHIAGEERARSSASPRSSTTLVGFGLAFGDGGNGIVGGSGFFPSVDELLAVGAAPFSWFSTIPARRRLPLRGRVRRRLAGDRLGRDGRARRSSGSTSPSASSSRSSTPSSRTGSGARTAGCSRGACRTSPARRSCTTRARSPALAGALLLGPRIGKFGADGSRTRSPATTWRSPTLGMIILWFGWFGFNPGSTLGVVTGDKLGYFAYVALTTNLAAAAGALGAVVDRRGS